MMLELLVTRQNTLDRTVIANAEGLDYLVLDELHTYRGRQGADVAMLVRRVRDRLATKDRRARCHLRGAQRPPSPNPVRIYATARRAKLPWQPTNRDAG